MKSAREQQLLRLLHCAVMRMGAKRDIEWELRSEYGWSQEDLWALNQATRKVVFGQKPSP